jgi:hypothetical protein
LFFSEIGVWTQGFPVELYLLSHTSRPFCSSYFGDEVSCTICLH